MNPLSTDLRLFEQFDVALLDLDGVVYRGPLPVEFAPEMISQARSFGMSTVFVTNNAARTPDEVAQHLSDLGIPTKPHEVRTAAQAAAAYIAQTSPNAQVFVIGGKGLRVALEAEGIACVDSATQNPDVVVQGFAKDVGWEALAEGVYAINQGAKYVASNLDATLPTERGMAPGNGSLVAAVRHATGITPVSTGKPAAAIFEQAAAQAKAKNPLVIGDRLDTDIKGANAAQMPSLHVLTGVDDARNIIHAPDEYRPTHLADDLRALIEPYTPVNEVEAGIWQCAGEYAQVRDGKVWLWREGEGSSSIGTLSTGADEIYLNVHQYRSVVHGCWAWLDSGRKLAELPKIKVQRKS